MTTLTATKSQLIEIFAKFSNEVLNFFDDEYYTSEVDMANDIFGKFINWYWKEDIAREKRYEEYLKLKAEFENENV